MNEEFDAIVATVDEEKWPRLFNAGLSPLDRAVLRWFAAKVHPPFGILELGTGLGGSCAELRRGASREVPIWTVDILDRPKSNIQQMENVFFFHENSRHFDFRAKTGLNGNQPLGLLFVDASHEYDDALHDIERFENLIHPDGYIIVHDFGFYETVVRAVIDFLALHRNYRIEFLWPGFDWSNLEFPTIAREIIAGTFKLEDYWDGAMMTFHIVLRKAEDGE